MSLLPRLSRSQFPISVECRKILLASFTTCQSLHYHLTMLASDHSTHHSTWYQQTLCEKIISQSMCCMHNRSSTPAVLEGAHLSGDRRGQCRSWCHCSLHFISHTHPYARTYIRTYVYCTPSDMNMYNRYVCSIIHTVSLCTVDKALTADRSCNSQQLFPATFELESSPNLLNMYVRMYVHMCTMHSLTHIHTHTHTHTHSPPTSTHQCCGNRLL